MKNGPLIINPLTAKGFPIDALIRLALDRVRSLSALWARMAVKELINGDIITSLIHGYRAISLYLKKGYR